MADSESTEPSPFPAYQSPPSSLSPTPKPPSIATTTTSSTAAPSSDATPAKPSSPKPVSSDSPADQGTGFFASLKSSAVSGLAAVGLVSSDATPAESTPDEEPEKEDEKKEEVIEEKEKVTEKPVEEKKPKGGDGKQKRKKKRGPRVARKEDLLEDSDVEQAAAASQSESDASSQSGSESEEESETEKDNATKESDAKDASTSTAKTSTPPPAATLAQGQTPDWSDMMNEDDVPEMNFDEFNRSGLTATTASKPATTAQTRSLKPTSTPAASTSAPKKAAVPKPGLSPEEVAKRADEKKARQKEKKKERNAKKREELKAGGAATGNVPKKEGELEEWGTGGVAAGPAKKAAPKKEKAASTTGESTSEADGGPSEPSPTVATAPAPRISNRQAYLQKISNDPKFVPRVGNFWTHDERHYAPGVFGQGDSEYSGLRDMSEYWRGRGRGRGGRGGFPVRGGFRGGRGGFVGPASQGMAQGQGQPPRQPPPHQSPHAAAAAPRPIPNGPEPAETVDTPLPEVAETDGAVKVNVPVNQAPKPKWGQGGNPASDKDWTHDGYAEIKAEEDRRAAFARGRGRGGPNHGFRGAMNGQRGGMVQGQARQWVGGPGRGVAPQPAVAPQQAKLAMDSVLMPQPAAPAAKRAAATVVASTSGPIDEDVKVKKNWQADLVKQQQHAAAAEKVIVRLPPSVSSTGAASDGTQSRRTSEAQNNPMQKEIPVETVILPPSTHRQSSTTPAEPPHAGSGDMPKPIPVTAANLQNQSGESEAVSQLQLQAEYAALRQQQELMRQTELRIQEEMRKMEMQRMQQATITASESGSVGSGAGTQAANGNGLPPTAVMVDGGGGYYDPATGRTFQFFPTPSPGPQGYSPVPMQPNGMPNASRIPSGLSSGVPTQQAYYPQQQQQQQQQPYYGQQAGMNEYMQQQQQMRPQQQQQQQQRNASGSFNPFTPTYPTHNIPLATGGRESPYSASPSNIPHFMPPRQNSKIQIRAPSSEDIASLITKPRKSSNPAYPADLQQQQQLDYQGGQNPYAYQGNGQGQRQDPRQYYAGQGQQQYPQQMQQQQQQPLQYGQQEGYEYGYNPQYGGGY